MEHVAEHIPYQSNAGGRIASDKLRLSQSKCMEFSGLEQGTNRYELLLIVKKLGKFAGFTPRMIQLLDYYMAFTRDADWKARGRPIVYQSLSRTALDLGVSERQIQKLEKALADLGAVTWNDSGNHKRYGRRDEKTGRILFAFGIELTPLAAIKAELEDKLRQKEMAQAAWMETKRQISWYRSQIRSVLAEWQNEGRGEALADYQRQYDEMARPIRTHLDLTFLRSLLECHKTLHSEITDAMGVVEAAETDRRPQQVSNSQGTRKSSSKDEQKFAHYKSTKQQSFNKLNTSNLAGNCFQKDQVEPVKHQSTISSTGMEHVRIGSVLHAASNRFKEHLPLTEPGWPDIIEAAARLLGDLGISQASWGFACQMLGRDAAALCILITDSASSRAETPVRQPAAYFHGMINRAKVGELHLHKSVFGLAGRQYNKRPVHDRS